MRHGRRDPGEGVVFGIMLIAVGVLFLLHRMGYIGMGEVWSWWPFLVIGLGLVRVVLWRSAKSVASGLGMALFGCWFLISDNGWFGLTWSGSWPLALVAIGISMVARAALEPLFDGRDGGAPEDARDA